MADEILEMKIQFAHQLLIVFKIFAVLCCIVTVAGVAFALYHDKLRVVWMGLLAGGAATIFMLYNHRHIRQWLAINEGAAPEIDRQ